VSERGGVGFVSANNGWSPEPVGNFLDARRRTESKGRGFLGGK
jgi:hypothetical protein